MVCSLNPTSDREFTKRSFSLPQVDNWMPDQMMTKIPGRLRNFSSRFIIYFEHNIKVFPFSLGMKDLWTGA